MITENDRLPRTYKFTVETLYFINALAKLEKRSNTNLLELLVQKQALENNIKSSDKELNKFLKELNETRNNKK
ncbi:hypothetical protein LPB90_18180 [Chryseobacterium sp. LC2016-29]|uniref:hypothetical protein n=1 Tax=Chryseobacterium sp. LC2016-29 TaxID=2897331 RepID=UPI001E3292B6|nr:hypothetical protein [Chryseobacterium sp. LC2016-29]MCD0480370.1 hypothetical protein [Chryseobacterium sp. LC2016-29]